ncbi:Uncharacterised protein [Mycolicibacterium flavescens]|nr:Uncharacterised protein [Mycolicibacterium flavescens]
MEKGTAMFTKHHSAAAPLGTVIGVVLVRVTARTPLGESRSG